MLVAVVGATGLVGTKMLRVLEERNFPVTSLLPVASERSWGKKVSFQGKEWTVMSADEAIAQKPALALFSAGGAVSGELAPRFAAAGCRVVDNSSFWRMDPTVPLVVPEINPDAIGPENYIIANPNCSTIQMVLPLAPLHKAFGIKRIVVSTYQSVTGAHIIVLALHNQRLADLFHALIFSRAFQAYPKHAHIRAAKVQRKVLALFLSRRQSHIGLQHAQRARIHVLQPQLQVLPEIRRDLPQPLRINRKLLQNLLELCLIKCHHPTLPFLLFLLTFIF